MGQYLICYDIRDPQRLQRVYNFLRGHGRHIQYSVFLCQTDRRRLLTIINQLEALIEHTEDDVRIYSLPEDHTVAVLGQGDRTPESVYLFED